MNKGWYAANSNSCRLTSLSHLQKEPCCSTLQFYTVLQPPAPVETHQSVPRYEGPLSARSSMLEIWRHGAGLPSTLWDKSNITQSSTTQDCLEIAAKLKQVLQALLFPLSQRIPRERFIIIAILESFKRASGVKMTA